RLRQLLTSATILNLKPSGRGYWPTGAARRSRARLNSKRPSRSGARSCRPGRGSGDDLTVQQHERGVGPAGPGPPTAGYLLELGPGGDAVLDGLLRQAGGDDALGPQVAPPGPVGGGGE